MNMSEKRSLLSGFRWIMVVVLLFSAFVLGIFQFITTHKDKITPEQNIVARLQHKVELPLTAAKVEELKDSKMISFLPAEAVAVVKIGDWMVVYDEMVIFYRLQDDQIIKILKK